MTEAETFIRLPGVERITGIKKTTIYREIARGEFPQQVPLTSGRSVGWAESEVIKWQQERKKNRMEKRKPITSKAANDNQVLNDNYEPHKYDLILRS